MIDVKNVSFSYRSKKIINDVSFHVTEGSCVALLGTNGVGKSTLLKMIDNILQPDDGEIKINNKLINEVGQRDLAKIISYVEQQKDSCHLSVFESVLLGRKPYVSFQFKKEDYKKTYDVLEKLDLLKYKDRPLNELSGGERQIVAIARALVQDTKVILFDEPTSNLDPKNQQDILNIIKELNTTYNKTVIITLHDINQALMVASDYLLLKEGRVLAFGDKTVLNKKNLFDLYGVTFSSVQTARNELFYNI